MNQGASLSYPIGRALIVPLVLLLTYMARWSRRGTTMACLVACSTPSEPLGHVSRPNSDHDGIPVHSVCYHVRMFPAFAGFCAHGGAPSVPRTRGVEP